MANLFIIRVKDESGNWVAIPALVGPKGDAYEITDEDYSSIAQIVKEYYSNELTDLKENKVEKPIKDGAIGQVLATDGEGNTYWKNVSGGGEGGTSDYEELENKPSINNVKLTGNKSLKDLGIDIPEVPEWSMAPSKPSYSSSEITYGTTNVGAELGKQNTDINKKVEFGGETASLSINRAEGETVRVYEASEVDDLIDNVRAVKTGTFTPTAGVASSGSVVYTGGVALANITTGEIPSGVWTTVGTVMPKPRLEVSAVALNGAVVEFGNLRIGVNGDVRVYQRTGTVQQFYGVNAMYLI